jgi:two-component system response regulator DegU
VKVLIVEDSPPMLKMIRRTISGWADEICECGDGGEAVLLYAVELPDWVLMDVDLKEVNGIAAASQIINNFPQAKVVMVTNYNDREIRKAAAEAGACGYVLKENLLELRGRLESIQN